MAGLRPLLMSSTVLRRSQTDGIGPVTREVREEGSSRSPLEGPGADVSTCLERSDSSTATERWELRKSGSPSSLTVLFTFLQVVPRLEEGSLLPRAAATHERVCSSQTVL